MKTVLYFCVALALLFTLPVQAGLVTYNGTVSPSTVGSTVTTDLPMFNIAGATLTDVQITLNFTVTPFGQVGNFTSPSPLVFSASYWDKYSYTPSNIWTVTHGSDSWTLAAPTVTTGQIYGSGQAINYLSILKLVGDNSAPVTLTAAGSNLAGYIGAGNLSFGTSGPGDVLVSAGPLYGGGGGDLTGTASVTYTYTPEPATMTLLGLGALVLRKRKA